MKSREYKQEDRNIGRKMEGERIRKMKNRKR